MSDADRKQRPKASLMIGTKIAKSDICEARHLDIRANSINSVNEEVFFLPPGKPLRTGLVDSAGPMGKL